MASIIIQTDNSENLELIATLAKKLGIHVSYVTDKQSEDLALGNMMYETKTEKSISRNAIMQKLRK
jgi:CheY-like chemotaxis protein